MKFVTDTVWLEATLLLQISEVGAKLSSSVNNNMVDVWTGVVVVPLEHHYGL
jgi:hypothetical protein